MQHDARTLGTLYVNYISTSSLLQTHVQSYLLNIRISTSVGAIKPQPLIHLQTPSIHTHYRTHTHTSVSHLTLAQIMSRSKLGKNF